jgi:nicotinamidase-related amidase
MQFEPSRTAILAMDFQGNILATLANPEGVVTRAAEAIAATRTAGGLVVFVRVAFTRDELSAFPPHSAMGQRMNTMAEKVLSDAPSTQVDPRLGLKQGDICVRKRRVGPFSSTDLNVRLRTAGVDTLVLSGIHTSGCVLSGMREAHDLDYRLIVLSDACADPDPTIHEVLTSKIFPKQGSVMTVEAYRRALEANGG